jgi:hypothetical protein
MADYWKHFTFTYHLCLGRPSGLSPSGFLTKTYVFPFTIHHILLHFITIIMHDRRATDHATDHATRSDSSYFHPLMPTYSPSLNEIINSFLVIIFCTDTNGTSLYEYLPTLTLFLTVPGK